MSLATAPHLHAVADAILLLGPTGSGKSALALELAQLHPVEIVSVDSTQVYRGLDLGSAKPTPAERAVVPHHLIDIRDAAEPYSAAEFVQDAGDVIDAIRARGRIPLLVGGTMLYAKALRDGLSDLPSADAAVRAALEAEARAVGWPALHARLARVDPTTAARLAPLDAQRIQRALEIYEIAGRPMSLLLARQAPARHRLALVALAPERATLHRRIEQRFDAMLAQGFLDEVRALRARGDLSPDLPALRSVGYRQAWRHLEGHGTPAEFRAAAIAATRRLAKRQMTWLRSLAPDLMLDPAVDDARRALGERLAALRRS
jgi:tRNA dimethylallyltransferase